MPRKWKRRGSFVTRILYDTRLDFANADTRSVLFNRDQALKLQQELEQWMSIPS